jgi:hypothetical protein
MQSTSTNMRLCWIAIRARKEIQVDNQQNLIRPGVHDPRVISKVTRGRYKLINIALHLDVHERISISNSAVIFFFFTRNNQEPSKKTNFINNINWLAIIEPNADSEYPECKCKILNHKDYYIL